MIYWRRFGKALFVLFFGFQIVYFGIVAVLSVSYTWINPPISTLMVLRTVQGVKVKPMQFLPLRQIPRSVRDGVIYLEDHNFWTHHGIVLGAIREAFEANRRYGYAAFGGSTITQQLARTLFLVPNKTYTRKYLEAGTAIVMETILSKERILELYLNAIEWGPGTFGVQAGARFQFKTDVRKLDREELARLQAILTNPIKYNVRTLFRNGGMAARYYALMADS